MKLPTHRATQGALVCALLLVTLSCNGKVLQNIMNPPTPAEGGTTPALGVTDESGRLLDHQSVAGRVVIVDFWASWCAPCQHSIPFYRRMHERFRTKGLVVVGINVDDEKPAMVDYVSMHPMPFSLVWDGEKALSGRFGVMQLPTTFLFDKRGRLRKTRAGFDPAEARAVEDEIRLLLSEEG